MAEMRLPSDYVPYKVLVLCSNALVNVPVPIRVGDQPVLLIGWNPSPVSQVPAVWLAAPAAPDSKAWVFVVEHNRPLRPLILVETNRPVGTVTVRVGDTLVLRAKHVSVDTAVVDALDMRPLGLVAFGDDRAIHIGGMTMERNRLVNLQTAFAIGSEEIAGTGEIAGAGT